MMFLEEMCVGKGAGTAFPCILLPGDFSRFGDSC